MAYHVPPPPALTTGTCTDRAWHSSARSSHGMRTTPAKHGRGRGSEGEKKQEEKAWPRSPHGPCTHVIRQPAGRAGLTVVV